MEKRIRMQPGTRLVCLGHINGEWCVWDVDGNEADEYGPYISRINLRRMIEKEMIRHEETNEWIPLLFHTRATRIMRIANELDYPNFPKLPKRAYEYAHERFMEELALEGA